VNARKATRPKPQHQTSGTILKLKLKLEPRLGG
jgi:hypothetical protein